MEDYTYHLAPGGQQVLGAHMLEVCPSIAGATTRRARSIRSRSAAGRIRCGSSSRRRRGRPSTSALLDLGDRFRLIANEVDVVEPDEPLPRLPVARAVWRPQPDFATSAEAWLIGRRPAPHGADRRSTASRSLSDFAEIAGDRAARDRRATRAPTTFEKELRWNQAYYHLARGL